MTSPRRARRTAERARQAIRLGNKFDRERKEGRIRVRQRRAVVRACEKLHAELPANALTGDNALTAKVGETVRIYFGIGGPNKTPSFHVIGEVFDKVYQLASLTTEPLSDVQTITVPPEGAAAVDMKLEVPGEYVLVDHALSRSARGLVGKLVVSGENQDELFQSAAPVTAELDHSEHSAH